MTVGLGCVVYHIYSIFAKMCIIASADDDGLHAASSVSVLVFLYIYIYNIYIYIYVNTIYNRVYVLQACITEYYI